MPEDQFVVPQFIDAEDKIFGPITVRQFVILLVGALVDFTLYALLSFVKFLMIGVPFIIFAGIVAFVRVNGQPFHFFLLNLIQTVKKPRLRVWDKTLTDAEVKMFMKEEVTAPPLVAPRKSLVASSRLQELTLVVNTGGVYQPEE